MILFIIDNYFRGNLVPDKSDIRDKHIQCVNCPEIKSSKVHQINSDELNMFRKFKVKCLNGRCDYVNEYMEVLRHMRDCGYGKRSYKVHSILNFLYFLRRDEPLKCNINELNLEGVPIINALDFGLAFDQKLIAQQIKGFVCKSGFRAKRELKMRQAISLYQSVFRR